MPGVSIPTGKCPGVLHGQQVSGEYGRTTHYSVRTGGAFKPDLPPVPLLFEDAWRYRDNEFGEVAAASVPHGPWPEPVPEKQLSGQDGSLVSRGHFLVPHQK